MTAVQVGVLEGQLVRLEPLGDHHVAPLAAAAAEDRSTYGYTWVPEGQAAMSAYVAKLHQARSAGETVPFVQVRRADERVVGVTRYLSIRFREQAAAPYAVEVGGTWLAASAQRAGVNVEAKLLLFTHAFDVWGVGRVDLKTDARNARSRAAIAGVGAAFEGILRGWQPSDVIGEEALLRDTAMFSITAAEWPQVRQLLTGRLTR